MAGLVALLLALAADIVKLMVFKWLLYAVVLAPIVLHFFLFVLVHVLNTSHTRVHKPSDTEAVKEADLELSGKVIASLATLPVVTIGYATMEEEELLDSNTALGLVIGGILILSSFGWWLDAEGFL
ncbi:MAG: hypothetical protein ACE5GK_03465 [Nitrospiria bacterium]